MYLGELAALATSFFWSLTAIFFAYSGRRIGAGVVNRSRLLFAVLLLMLTHFLLEGSFYPQNVEPYRWFWLGISSLFGLVLGDTFLFYAFVLVGPRLSTLMMATVPIIGTLGGWLFLGERLGRYELLGIGLTLLGVAWVVTEKHAPPMRPTAVETETEPSTNPNPNRKYYLGLLFAFGGAVGQAINLLTARFGMDGGFPTISASLIRLSLALLVLWGITAVRGEIRYTFRQWSADHRAFGVMFAGSIVGPFLGIWASLVAVQYAPLGIAATLMALPPIFVIPLEWLFYRQPVSPRAIVGTLIALSGVAVIFLLGGG
jgi:drug/metabolite transporter (DMT)-like permease